MRVASQRSMKGDQMRMIATLMYVLAAGAARAEAPFSNAPLFYIFDGMVYTSSAPSVEVGAPSEFYVGFGPIPTDENSYPNLGSYELGPHGVIRLRVFNIVHDSVMFACSAGTFGVYVDDPNLGDAIVINGSDCADENSVPIDSIGAALEDFSDTAINSDVLPPSIDAKRFATRFASVFLGGQASFATTIDSVTVPEPSSAACALAALGVVLALRRRHAAVSAQSALSREACATMSGATLS